MFDESTEGTAMSFSPGVSLATMLLLVVDLVALSCLLQ